jgi:hypothetical protein
MTGQYKLRNNWTVAAAKTHSRTHLKHTNTSNNDNDNNNNNNTADAQAHTVSKTVQTDRQTDSEGHAVPQGSPRPLRAEARFQSQVSQCGICGGQSVTENRFSPRTSTVACQCHFMLHTHPSFIDVVKLCTWCMTSQYTHRRSETSPHRNSCTRHYINLAVNKNRQINAGIGEVERRAEKFEFLMWCST